MASYLNHSSFLCKYISYTICIHTFQRNSPWKWRNSTSTIAQILREENFEREKSLLIFFFQSVNGRCTEIVKVYACMRLNWRENSLLSFRSKALIQKKGLLQLRFIRKKRKKIQLLLREYWLLTRFAIKSPIFVFNFLWFNLIIIVMKLNIFIWMYINTNFDFEL